MPKEVALVGKANVIEMLKIKTATWLVVWELIFSRESNSR